jgi:hypothetical protein
MKREAGCVLAIVVAVGLMAGCVTTPPADDKTPFEIIQSQESEITAAGGCAVVGEASSRTVHLALDRAQTRGREKLATEVAARVAAVKGDFLKELGGEDAAEVDKLFSAAGKYATHQIVSSGSPKDLRYENRDNLTSAWALMAADPRDIANAIAKQSKESPHLYTRFRASKTFAELEEAIKTYDAAKIKARP